jgi:hypothetical protein
MFTTAWSVSLFAAFEAKIGSTGATRNRVDYLKLLSFNYHFAIIVDAFLNIDVCHTKRITQIV